MENDSDMLNILSSDENQANFEILNSDLEENAIPLEIMVRLSNFFFLSIFVDISQNHKSLVAQIIFNPAAM